MMPLQRMNQVILVALLLLPVISLAEDDSSEILAEMTETLGLTEEQVPQVGAILQKFATDMEAASAMTEVEEPDNQAIMGAVKKAKSDFKSGMKDVLDKEQFETLETTLDAIIQEMFEDIAEIRIMDLEEPLGLSEEQATALKPVMGTGMRDLIGVIFEYGDKRLSAPRKVKMGKKLKRIQSDMEKGVAGILTEEQMAKYQALKEESKS
jgi:hypothetical protein